MGSRLSVLLHASFITFALSCQTPLPDLLPSTAHAQPAHVPLARTRLARRPARQPRSTRKCTRTSVKLTAAIQNHRDWARLSWRIGSVNAHRPDARRVRTPRVKHSAHPLPGARARLASPDPMPAVFMNTRRRTESFPCADKCRPVISPLPPKPRPSTTRSARSKPTRTPPYGRPELLRESLELVWETRFLKATQIASTVETGKVS